MAGRFDGLSDIEWQLFADIFPPAPLRRSRGDAPYAPSQSRQHLALRADHRLSLVRSSPGASMGVQKCGASVAAALASRWHARGPASPHPRHCRGARDHSMAVRGRRRLFFPLAKAAVRAWPMAAKVKASSSTVSPTRPACLWPTIPRLRMGMSALRSCRCWTRSTSEPAGVDAPGSVPKSLPPIQGMMPKTCASNSAHGASGPRSRNGSGRPRNHETARARHGTVDDDDGLFARLRSLRVSHPSGAEGAGSDLSQSKGTTGTESNRTMGLARFCGNSSAAPPWAMAPRTQPQ